ncbi:hypothetical protein TNCV_3825981 [Trichonephila clavipes]|nr:hypothetical protein TNCV_3825981 [Trichonephila clavipes]
MGGGFGTKKKRKEEEFLRTPSPSDSVRIHRKSHTTFGRGGLMQTIFRKRQFRRFLLVFCSRKSTKSKGA